MCFLGAPRIPPGPLALEVEVEGLWVSEGDLGMRVGALGVTLEGAWDLLATLEMAFGGDFVGAVGDPWGALGEALGAVRVTSGGPWDFSGTPVTAPGGALGDR